MQTAAFTDCAKEITWRNQLFPLKTIVVNEGHDSYIDESDLIANDGACDIRAQDVRFYHDDFEPISTAKLRKNGESCLNSVDGAFRDFRWSSNNSGCDKDQIWGNNALGYEDYNFLMEYWDKTVEEFTWF